MPQLWVLAGDDRDAPNGVTRECLVALKQAGNPIDLHVYPHTGHGMYEFAQKPNDSRQNTRITDGYFRLLSDWIRQQDKPPYGSGQRIH